MMTKLMNVKFMKRLWEMKEKEWSESELKMDSRTETKLMMMMIPRTE